MSVVKGRNSQLCARNQLVFMYLRQCLGNDSPIDWLLVDAHCTASTGVDNDRYPRQIEAMRLTQRLEIRPLTANMIHSLLNFFSTGNAGTICDNSSGASYPSNPHQPLSNAHRTASTMVDEDLPSNMPQTDQTCSVPRLRARKAIWNRRRG